MTDEIRYPRFYREQRCDADRLSTLLQRTLTVLKHKARKKQQEAKVRERTYEMHKSTRLHKARLQNMLK